MSSLNRWFTRLGAVLTAASLAIFIPVAAWASTSDVADLAIEEARRRRGGGGFFLIGGLCCLVVVGLIVLGVVMALRKRRR